MPLSEWIIYHPPRYLVLSGDFGFYGHSAKGCPFCIGGVWSYYHQANRARTSEAPCVQFAYSSKRASSLLVSRRRKYLDEVNTWADIPPLVDDNQTKRVCACTRERVQIAPRLVRCNRARVQRTQHEGVEPKGVYTVSLKRMIIKRRESVLAQASECRLLLGALGEAEQSAKRKAQKCFAPKGVYTMLALMICTAEP